MRALVVTKGNPVLARIANRLPLMSCVAVAGWLLLAPAPLLAQSNSLFGSRGPLSQGNSGAATGFGQTSGLGTTGTTTGLNTTAGTGGLDQLGALSGTIGQGFVGRADNLGRFVGNNQATTGGTAGNRGGGLQGFNRNSGTGQRNPQPGNQNNGNFGGNRATSRPMFRPRVEIGFDWPQASTTEVRRTLSTRLTALGRRYPQLAGVELAAAADGTFVLTGQVADERTRRMAAHLLRLEPGVRRIDNRLTVGGLAAPAAPGARP